jgi:hypothetical protein
MATRYNYTGGIVTNGLVLNLDAAKTDSYPGTGTTWRDLSGRGNNGTLINGPTFSGIGKQASIVFDGADDYVLNNTLTPLITNQLTISVWFFATDVSTDNFIISSENSTFNNSKFLLFQDKVAFFSGRVNTYTFIPGDSTTGNIRMEFASNSEVLNQWVNITCTFIANNSTGIRGYKNGIEDPNSPVNASTVGPLSSTDPLYIGLRNPSTDQRFFDGRIGAVQIYNRALTAQEITQNFNALRGRYGI